MVEKAEDGAEARRTARTLYVYHRGATDCSISSVKPPRGLDFDFRMTVRDPSDALENAFRK
jgi:hypothetical protein